MMKYIKSLLRCCISVISKLSWNFITSWSWLNFYFTISWRSFIKSNLVHWVKFRSWFCRWNRCFHRLVMARAWSRNFKPRKSWFMPYWYPFGVFKLRQNNFTTFIRWYGVLSWAWTSFFIRKRDFASKRVFLWAFSFVILYII